MHPNERLITDFYSAFARRDADAMVACYHPEVTFSDPVFPDLRGPQAGAMWRMLTSRSQGLTLTFSDVRADDTEGSARWEAIYPFSETGRTVHNRIQAKFRFRDGKIIEHRDHFDLWAWTRMALGVKGVLMGWLPPVQGAIQKKAARSLAHFMAKQ